MYQVSCADNQIVLSYCHALLLQLCMAGHKVYNNVCSLIRNGVGVKTESQISNICNKNRESFDGANPFKHCSKVQAE
jgi:hypothetical protein